MAQKRMFSLQIVDTDAFLDMPQTSQLLYFHLAMRADDEGFLGNPKRIIKTVGANDDDYKILVAKRFILEFESGVVVIKHWLIHNTIRMDRFNPTNYKEEKNALVIKENKSYSEVATSWQPVGNHLEPQVKLSKVNLSKVKLDAPTNKTRDFFENEENQLEVIELLKEKYGSDIFTVEVKKFISYWTEPNSRGKQRWQLQPTFEVQRRLATWLSRVKEFNGMPTGRTRKVIKL